MRNLSVLAILGALLLVIVLSVGHAEPARPLGVSAEDWISVNENLGFVVVPSRAASSSKPGQMSTFSSSAVPGYFMARTKDGWRRLSSVDPISVMPAGH